MEGYSKDHHAHIIHLNGNPLEDSMSRVARDIKSAHKGEIITSRIFMYDSLSIEEAREIVLTEKNKNQKNERRLLFIGFNSINILAQNTLLKILEEPPLRTSFILFVSSPDILLSTICSRCIILTLAGDEKDEKSFLETPYKERLEWVKTLLENKALIGHFFYSLEREIEMFIKKGKISRTEVKALQIPLQYKHMLLNLTPTSKYLLEEIALTLPLIKER